jgi:signal transduction histidine kinase
MGAFSLTILLLNRRSRRLVELTKIQKKELEKVNAELIKLSRTKEEFISMVSHELRTPLTPIKGYSEMLMKPKYMEGAVLNKKQKKAVDTIIKSVTSLETLIGDVLDVYKIDLNRLTLNKTSIGVKELITQNVDNLKSIADEKGITFVTDLMTKNDTKVFCDPTRVGQVFGNLIKNSVDFVKEKEGKMAIGVDYYSEANEGVDQSPSDVKTGHMIRYLVFWVNDNGPGIPHDKIDKLFSKFYQIDTSLTRKHGGTGLGLAVCKGIVEAHGGKIWVDKNYKNGTSIRFTLPAIEDDDPDSIPTGVSTIVT